MRNNLLVLGMFLFAVTGLFAQAANDDCSMAQAIAVDEVVNFSTLMATTDGPNHPDCLGENDSIPADVWFTWTPAADGAYRWSNCNDADFDSRMAIYAVDNACDASDENLVSCNDDGDGCELFTSEAVFAATAGQTYMLRLGGFANDTIPTTMGSGTVTLSEITNGPPNDLCGAAAVVLEGTDQPFTTGNAITDGPNHDNSTGCFGFNSNTIVSDVWYLFTPVVDGSYKWSTCGSVDFDTRLGVYSVGQTCPPSPDDLLFCNDDGSGADCPANQYHSELFFDAVAGTTYLLRLGGFNGAGSGTFDLVNETPPSPPDNDLCENAIAAPLITEEAVNDGDFSMVGTTIGATFELEDYIFPQCLNNQNGGEFSDVWYTIETFGNEELVYSILGAGQGNNPAIVFFMDFFYDCGTQVDSNMLQTNCIVSSPENPQPVGILSGLPADESLTLYVRITSRVTSDPPGQFAFYVSGDITSSVTDLDVAKNLQLFPNPVQDRATVRFQLSEASQLQAAVVDVMGRRVQQLNLGQLPSGANQFSLETDQLPAGVYTLQLTNGKGVQSQKFVVN